MVDQVETIAAQNPGFPVIGRVELQQSILQPNFLAMLAYCDDQRDRDHKGYILAGFRYERTVDGAGVPHYTLYASYDPPSAEPVRLDPRNLNNAEQNVLGQPDLNVIDIGNKERRF